MRTETDLRETVEYLADQAPAGDALLRNLWQARRRRQRRIIIVTSGLVAAAVMIVALIGAVRIMTPHTVTPAGPVTSAVPSVAAPTDRRVAGNWSMISTVTPPSGWQVSLRDVSRNSEMTTLKPANTGDDNESVCTVLVGSRNDDTVSPPTGSQTTVAGRSGYYRPTAGDPNHSGSFIWEYTSGAWADADCVSVPDPTSLLTRLVAGFHLSQQEVRIPFELAGLPDGYNVKQVSVGSDNMVELGEVENDPGIETISVLWSDEDAGSLLDGAAESAQLGDNSVLIGQFNIGGPSGICLAGRPTVCAYDPGADANTSADLQQRMRQLMTAMRPAADLTDETSWPSATGLPE